LFQNLNELFAILQGTDSEKVINASIEKIKSGIFKLEQIGGESEAIFFKSKLADRENEKKAQEEALEEANAKNKKEKQYTILAAIVFFILVYTLHSFHTIGSFITLILYMAGCWILVYAFRNELKKIK
jgi:predicted histidine transporter YuiF (NhaC family)